MVGIAKCAACGQTITAGWGIFLNKPVCAGCKEVIEKSAPGET